MVEAVTSNAREPLGSQVPPLWRDALAPALALPSFAALETFLAEERRTHRVFPAHGEEFAALQRVGPEQVRVVVLGQDPYHGAGEAHGLAFSVRRGVGVPPSLRNIHKELLADVGVPVPNHGSLDAWCSQGVLLLNTVLTVREDEAGSHRKKGWEAFTSAVLETVARQPRRVVFILWGKDAQARRPLVDVAPHHVVAGVHPSPLSAHRGFAGSRPFSQANAALVAAGREPVEWALP